MRLRGKLMLALLSTGLAAVAMVGGLAFISVSYKVDAIRREQAAAHFHQAITAYLTRYGDWRTAVASESLDSFSRHQNLPLAPGDEGARPQPERAGGPSPFGMAQDGPPPEGDGPTRQRGALARAGFPPPQDGPPGFGTPHDAPPGFGPPPERPGPPGAHGRNGGPGGPGGRAEPRFRFILADADYRVLLGGGQYHPGEELPQAVRATARAIVVKGRQVAYMSTDGVFKPTREEQEYLDAMKSSLQAGVAAAAVLAIALGMLLSRGMSNSMHRLTKAVRAMHQGELRQRLPVTGKDEVAELTAAFNEMSEQLARQAEQLRELSIRDALTQLYNRRHFDEQASTLYKQAVRHRRPLSLVICDIDHFKKINDRFSHATGDEVLRRVAGILLTHMRQSDLVARYGGEEFVMAFPETAGAQAAILCDKLRGFIEGYDWESIHPALQVTISMGVCADIGQGCAEAMLQKADQQLYCAKASGRNRVCFN